MSDTSVRPGFQIEEVEAEVKCWDFEANDWGTSKVKMAGEIPTTLETGIEVLGTSEKLLELIQREVRLRLKERANDAGEGAWSKFMVSMARDSFGRTYFPELTSKALVVATMKHLKDTGMASALQPVWRKHEIAVREKALAAGEKPPETSVE